MSYNLAGAEGGHCLTRHWGGMKRMRVGRFLKQVSWEDGCSIGDSEVDRGIEGWGAEWDIVGSGAARGIVGSEVDRDRH